MAAKCPACGFESADDAQWCDFCKEPFNKKKGEKPAPAPIPEAKPANPAPPSALGPVSLEDLPREALAKLPPNLLPGQDGEKIPEAPKWLKPFAISFLAVVAIAAALLTMVFVVKIRRLPPR
jgi:hypothetical protein